MSKQTEKTIAVSASDGTTFDVPVGQDGKTPVTPNNPPVKAVTPEEPKQPKEKGIVDPKAPITPNNPPNEKALGFLSEDHGGLVDSAPYLDQSPNTVRNPDAPESDTGTSDPADFTYAAHESGTYINDDGVQKAVVAKDDESEGADSGQESDEEREAREAKEAADKEAADKAAADGTGAQENKDDASKAPAKNASTEDWVAYAKSKGATDEDLKDSDGADLKRDVLIEKYGDA